MIFALAIAAVPSFVASIVEWVEAFTIVLAVGNTRGWRSPIWGTAAGLASLAVIVGVFGTPLIIFHEQVSQSFHIVVGILLLLFGMRWLRKAILRFAGIVALLTTFGIFWGAEGLLVEWPLRDVTLLVILGGVCLVSLVALRLLSLVAPQGARVAVRNI